MSETPAAHIRDRSNHGLEQTAHRLRQGMRQLERAAGLREELRRAAAQAECSTALEHERLGSHRGLSV
jgi:hypothetical protein